MPEPLLDANNFFDRHSGSLTILLLTFLVLVTLLILVPQLLRSHQRTMEMLHQERLRSLEQGIPPPTTNDLYIFAGRIALLVPMVVICAAATVTCFLVTYRTDNLFGVSLATWCVGGVVSLAAITGGVALMGRLAHVNPEEVEGEKFSEHPLEKG